MAKIKTIKVLIIDEQPVYSMGISLLLEESKKFNIVGIVNTPDEAVKTAQKENPSFVIMEIRLGKENGIDLIKKLKALNPYIMILVVSSNDEQYYSERVLRAGARGYIMKTEKSEKINEAINTILDGKIYLSEAERERVFQAITGERTRGVKDRTVSIKKLSNRELQVFTLIGKGYGTIEIASMFKISTKTIDSHKEHLKLKLHCNTSQELRQLAIEWTKT